MRVSRLCTLTLATTAVMACGPTRDELCATKVEEYATLQRGTGSIALTVGGIDQQLCAVSAALTPDRVLVEAVDFGDDGSGRGRTLTLAIVPLAVGVHPIDHTSDGSVAVLTYSDAVEDVALVELVGTIDVSEVGDTVRGSAAATDAAANVDVSITFDLQP